jgi:hypothetical protein
MHDFNFTPEMIAAGWEKQAEVPLYIHGFALKSQIQYDRRQAADALLKAHAAGDTTVTFTEYQREIYPLGGSCRAVTTTLDPIEPPKYYAYQNYQPDGTPLVKQTKAGYISCEDHPLGMRGKKLGLFTFGGL